MKTSKSKIDPRLISDFFLVMILIVSIAIYIESSSELQQLLTALKYNSLEGLNNGIAVLGSSGK